MPWHSVDVILFLTFYATVKSLHYEKRPTDFYLVRGRRTERDAAPREITPGSSFVDYCSRDRRSIVFRQRLRALLVQIASLCTVLRG